MFDFLDEDWFIITLEIVFLVLIIYDIRQYIRNKKKEYITNIVLTFGFAVWTLLPMHTKYFKWSEPQKQEMLKACEKEDNATLCRCENGSLFKEYGFDELKTLDTKELEEFKKEAKEDCLDDGWF
ncbi:MAG: hypothetical protein U9N02_05540 [Campylobacterota bacterium]|nr:hypothetical protein [Campylobacterota bacterium]